MGAKLQESLGEESISLKNSLLCITQRTLHGIYKLINPLYRTIIFIHFNDIRIFLVLTRKSIAAFSQTILWWLVTKCDIVKNAITDLNSV